MSMVRVALIALLTACQAALSVMGGGGASVKSVIAETVLPSPGGCVTDLTGSIGNLK
jgi:hypothetical protein